jgi:hypothetical protein
MVMKGKFYSPLSLTNSDTAVDARGWIEWAKIDPAITRVRVNATIAQDPQSHAGVGAYRFGHGTCGPYLRPGPGKPTQVDWRCDIAEDQGNDFFKGASDGSADLVDASAATTSAGWFWHWSDNPTLG